MSKSRFPIVDRLADIHIYIYIQGSYNKFPDFYTGI